MSRGTLSTGAYCPPVLIIHRGIVSLSIVSPGECHLSSRTMTPISQNINEGPIPKDDPTSFKNFGSRVKPNLGS